jgi:hypothetical protein
VNRNNQVWFMLLGMVLAIFTGRVFLGLVERGQWMLAFMAALIPIGAVYEWHRALSRGPEAAEVGRRSLGMAMVAMELIDLILRAA